VAYPRFLRARQHKYVTRTSGDITTAAINPATTWGNVDTGLDITLKGAVGDVVEVGLSGCWDDTAATYRLLDVVSIVSAAPALNWSGGVAEATTGQGIGAWRANTGVRTNAAGSVMRALLAGDIASGAVTLRLRYRGTDTATSRVLTASAAQPLHFWAKNLGPVAPH
jgi:hypothetical protein